jgi:O-antigen/teichoic acid export membrane protein
LKVTGLAQILAIGILVNSIGYIPSAFLQGIGRPDLTTKRGLLELPLYLGAVYLGAKEFGIIGVALAWMLRVFLDVPILLPLSRRNLNKIEIPLKGIVLGVVVIAIAGLLSWIEIKVLEKLMIMVVLFGATFVLVWSKLLQDEERGFIRRRLQDTVKAFRLQPQTKE